MNVTFTTKEKAFMYHTINEYMNDETQRTDDEKELAKNVKEKIKQL